VRKTKSLTPDYFEQLYKNDPDPWKFETSDYERAKYAATIAALGWERSQCALEVGCANGVLTRALAEHCQALLAIDVSPTALQQAKARCADLPHVTFRLAGLPDDEVPGAFDLIVLSEVAYYWDDRDAARAAEIFRRQHRPGGRLLLVHWLGETDYPVSGDDAVERLRRSLGEAVRAEQESRTPKYRLDLWRWAD
jgi:SAM-dependent methyltransferase